MTTFASLPIPGPLAGAIAARGYQNAMPVQIAVLEERCRDHDLLVSSQTGSGKTLAFGVLIAQKLLAADPAESSAQARRGRKPRALVIAPTRELANQVRSELAWLFADTPMEIAACTGGSDVRRDMKILARGTDMVVGTPGRLVDLLQREALLLGQVQMVVLDEADEMLDMGFREDLQVLLDAAVARDRTHMFSATLPKPIVQLAARYQREAVRVSAGAEGTAGAHADIEYVAHVVGFDDRLAAVVNVLRMHGDGKAILFGTTREGVARLHQAIARHGFRAVVLSGDRAQGERDLAMESFKKGDAQVLVATNVAARGLDLPEVDLVVHADLPLNAESLTHRSGRTGRAGRKGRSVVIADPAERRKAERLLAFAKAKFAWTPAPSAEAVAEAGRRRLEDELLAAGEPSDVEEARGLANRLLKNRDKDELLERLLARELARCPQGEALSPVDPKLLARAPRDLPELPPRRKRADFDSSSVIFRVNLGADRNAEPGWLLPLICRRGGVTRNEVGAIRVGPVASEFQIVGDAAHDFALAASRPDPRAPSVFIEKVGSTRPDLPGKKPGHDSDHPWRRNFTSPRTGGSSFTSARAGDGNFASSRAASGHASPHKGDKIFTSPRAGTDTYPSPHAASSNYPSPRAASSKYPSARAGTDKYPSPRAAGNKYPSARAGTDKYPSARAGTDKYPSPRSGRGRGEAAGVVAGRAGPEVPEGLRGRHAQRGG